MMTKLVLRRYIVVVILILMTVVSASGLAPVANFTSNVTSGSIYPLVVKFTDTSTNTPILWNWSFGDGRYSTNQNPTYHYAVAGKYNVSLTSTNGYGANTTTKQTI